MAGSTYIEVNGSGALKFGDYKADTKKKVDDFEVDGDIYKIKTYYEVTKLEKNGRLLYESVPGTNVERFFLDEHQLAFSVDGKEDAQITVELESDQEYKIYVNDVQIGKMKSNLSGKISLGVDFENGAQAVVIKKA